MNTISDQAQGLQDKKLGATSRNKSFFDEVKSLSIPAIAIVVLGTITQTFFPWWTIAVAAFLIGAYFAESWGKSFIYGFVAVTLLWTIYAGYIDSTNGGAMTSSISGLLGGVIKSTQLMYVTGLLGGLVGGFAAASGTLFRFLFDDFKKS